VIWRGIRALVCGADDGAPAPGISQGHDSRVNVGAIAAEGRWSERHTNKRWQTDFLSEAHNVSRVNRVAEVTPFRAPGDRAARGSRWLG
jgi:hypothetical protein